MNYKLMLRMLGRTLQVEALCLLLPLVVALLYREDPRPFLFTIVPVALLGTFMARIKSKSEFFSREGYAVVGLIWLILSLFGSLPFWFSGEFAGFMDCLFEIISGFTTSGPPSSRILSPCPGASCSGGPSPPGSAAWGCCSSPWPFSPR